MDEHEIDRPLNCACEFTSHDGPLVSPAKHTAGIRAHGTRDSL